MQQFDMVLTQTLNKFCTTTKNMQDIQFVIDNRPTILLFNIFYTNKILQKHNQNVFINTLGPTFIFKIMDINHQSCPSFYKLSNNPSKIISLHFTIHISIEYVV